MFGTEHTVVFGRVVMVASLGGMEALSRALAALPATFPVPVVVVQHRPVTSRDRDTLALVLAREGRLPVQVAEAGSSAYQPGVTVVPGATAATIDEDGRWVLSEAPRDTCPGDIVLRSSAASAPTIGVVLTGRLSDGSEGCRAVKRMGGRVLVQDPTTARASSMPANAIATGCADFVLPLDRIPSALVALTTAPGAAELLSVPLPPWARLTS